VACTEEACRESFSTSRHLPVTSIHLCFGPEKVETGYLCPCCKEVFEDEDMFLMSLCGACSFGMNNECERCVEGGVGFDKFQKGKISHRLRKVTPNGEPWVAVCGYTLPWDKVGGGLLTDCKKCWRKDAVDIDPELM
jgi:hypothetical protein